MWYRISAYIRFLLRSKNQHGVHSPFVYALVTHCFYDRKQYPFYKKLKKLYRILKNEDKHIPLKNGKLLARLSLYFKANDIVVFGNSDLEELYFSLSNTGKITIIENNSSVVRKKEKFFKKNKLNGITFYDESNKNKIHRLCRKANIIYITQPDNLWIQQYNELIPYINPAAVLLIKNIHNTPRSTKNWEVLKHKPTVRLSIDTFSYGFIFFRKKQANEHFYIRL